MRTRELSRPPRLLGLDMKAAVGAIPGASRLSFLAGGGGDMPELELVLDDVPVDRDHLARYCRVCSFRLHDELPPTYPHVVAFPLHLALLTHRRFPFAAVGLVHMSNQITRKRAIGTDERLGLRVHLTGLESHPRGQSFQIVTEVRAGSEPVWTERCTIIHRGNDKEPSAEGSSGEDAPRAGTRTAETWRIPRSTGFRYALASGDHNPIHVHSIPARISGLPGVVAPGMWTKARALASVEARVPTAMIAEVEFLRPIILPTETELGVGGGEGGLALAVRDAGTGRSHMTGRVREI